MQKSTNVVEVVRIDNIEKHPNADTLGIIKIWNYQVVVKLSDWKVGDLASYICPDNVVPDTPEYAFLQGHRRIKVKKLRGVISMGMLVPAPAGSAIGDDVTERLGIVHYVPPEPFSTGGEDESPSRVQTGVRKEPFIKKLRRLKHKILVFLGLRKGGVPEGPAPTPSGFLPVYDVDSWYKYSELFVEGEPVVATEKIHGCVSENTLIDTAEYGNITISKIVNEQLKVHIASLNLETNEIEYMLIEDWFKKENDGEWYEIELEDGSKLEITGNNPVYLPELKCYRPADILKAGDILLKK